MSIDRILSECPTLQRDLAEQFIEVGQSERLPFIEFLNSPENARLITQTARENNKLHTVEVVWNQRLPETEVSEGGNVLTCTSTNKYGDTTTTYELELTDNFQASQLVVATDLVKHCKENSVYFREQVLRLMNAIDRKVATAAATQAAALIGAWGTEVSGYYTVNGSDQLVLATRQSGGQALNEFTMADLQQAARMANYPGAIIGFGGAEMMRYANAVQAGCCTQYGINLMEISAQNGFAFAYDARLAAALGGNLQNLITTPGAMQWLSYNLAEWNAGFQPIAGSNYTKTKLFTPAGIAVDLNLKDDCGSLSIVVTAIGKVVALPTDIYEAGDKYAGVNYVNGLLITNP